MEINIKLNTEDEVNSSFIYLNAMNMYLGLTDLAENLRSMIKYGTDKTKEEILSELYDEVLDILIIDLRDDNKV